MAVVAQKWHHQKKYSNLLFYVRMMGLVRELSSMLTVEISKFNKIQHLFQSQYITSKLLTEREFILALVSKFSTLLQIWYSNRRVFLKRSNFWREKAPRCRSTFNANGYGFFLIWKSTSAKSSAAVTILLPALDIQSWLMRCKQTGFCQNFMLTFSVSDTDPAMMTICKSICLLAKMASSSPPASNVWIHRYLLT